MKIIQIVPGTSDTFYCENCVRDVALFEAIQRLGHQIVLVPMYLLVHGVAEAAIRETPIFFGGINVYLQRKSGFWRRTPRWIDRLFDSPSLLRRLARRAAMTNARHLGPMTISMLQGPEGKQAKELDRLLDWLCRLDERCDVVVLSNALLAGLAGAIKRRLGVPVVSLLQDEDGFLDSLPQPYREQAWGLLRRRADDLDALAAVSRYYAENISKRLLLEDNKVVVVYPGIDLAGFDAFEPPQVPTIGYLSRICHDKGADILLEAVIRLKQEAGLRDLKLRLAGGATRADATFVRKLKDRISSSGLAEDVDFVALPDRGAKLQFLDGLSVLAVPERKPIAFALYVLESLAAAVPVVQPRTGVFPELLEITGGGVMFEPNNAGALAEVMKKLLLEPAYARGLGRQGRKAVLEHFSVNRTAEKLLRILQRVVTGFRGAQNA